MKRTLLTIAGTDPSGGAGIQVDLQVFRDLGFHGASAITAVLWQNTQEVLGFRALEPDEVAAQIDAVFNDIQVDAVKVGMVPDVEIARAIAPRLEDLSVPIVIDTVFASGSGDVALAQGCRDIAATLLPLATIATPNVLEASQLLEAPVDPVSVLEAADILRRNYGLPALLLKAGHLDTTGDLRDILATEDDVQWLKPLKRVPVDVRGTGCQLSSAIAAKLAQGQGMREAIEGARVYLNRLLREQRAQIGCGRPVVVR